MPTRLIEALLETLRPAGSPAAEIWDGLDVRGLRRLVTVEGCHLWLYRRMHQIGALERLDEGFRGWLKGEATRVVATHQLLDSQRDRVAAILNDRGVRFVLLKGAARRLIRDDFPLADARPMCDVDLLVPEDDLELAWDALRGEGYGLQTTPLATPTDWVHLPPLADAAAVPIELHNSTQQGMSPGRSWERLFTGSREIDHGGVPMRVPCITELFWHSMVHALFHHADGFRLRHLLDGCSLVHSPEIDWEEIERRTAASELDSELPPRAARDWLATIRHLGDPEAEGPVEAFDIARVLDWNLRVVRRYSPSGRVARRAINECRRVELRMGPHPFKEGTGILLRTRRFLVSKALRGAYRIWRHRNRGRTSSD